MEILYGKPLAQQIREDLKERVGKMGKAPCLAVVRGSGDEGSAAYLRGAVKQAAQVGVQVKEFAFAEGAAQEDVIEAVERINRDPGIHGVLLLRPLPQGVSEDEVIDHLDPRKDAEGLTRRNRADIYTYGKGKAPCTAQAVLEILDYYGIPIDGKRAVVLGRSLTVGKPVSQLLLKRNATVTVCHSHTKDMPRIVAQAEILVAAIGKAKFVQGSWIRDGAVVIDVGMNRDEEGKLAGDVDFASLQDREVQATPVPGGVGSVTTALLLKKTVEEAEREWKNTD